jgi:hypothetical protein
MSLDQIVSAIVDEPDTSPYLRAIRLYELQVAISYPQDFLALTEATELTCGATKRLRTVRIYAGVKFLEKIEEELRQKLETDKIPLMVLAQDHRYQNIFDNVIAVNGGWTRIRHSIAARNLDKKLSRQLDLATAAANIVDFSYRFGQMPNPGCYRGGVTAARYVVANAKSYGFIGGRTTLGNRWRTFRPTAVFLYLLLIQKFPLFPPRLAAKNFSEMLLKQAQDLQLLRTFFCAYRHVSGVLAPRGYKFEKLMLNLHCEEHPLPTAAPQQDVIDAFEKSKGLIE